MKCRSYVTAIFLTFAVSSASGAFIDGVERFDGTVKDLTTWEQYPASGSGITQNDALNITGSGNRDYTTRSVAVGIGQRVTAEVTVTTPAETDTIYQAALLLTTNSTGTTKDSFFDSRFLGCQITFQDPSAQSTGRYFESIAGGNGGYGSKRFADGVPVSGATYLLSIQRDASTTFQVSASFGEGMLIFNDSFSYPAPDGGLYVSLHHTSLRFFFDSTSTFDNITITPEPNWNAVFLSLCALTLINRDSHLFPRSLF
jgi:hypothetical protein